MRLYLIFYVTENGKSVEIYSKEDLLKFETPNEGLGIFDPYDCAKNMLNKFNDTLREGEVSRHLYKVQSMVCSLIKFEEIESKHLTHDDFSMEDPRKLFYIR